MNITGRIFSQVRSGFASRVQRFKYSVQASISRDKEFLELKTETGVDNFPLVWLRDNCRCEKCYHAPSTSRTIDWSHFDVNIEAKSVEAHDDKIQVNWKDNHTSNYDLSWLKSRSFSDQIQQQYLDNVYRPNYVYWDKADFKNICHTYDYNEVTTNKQKFYEWLRDLSIYGVVMMDNAPTDDEGIIRKLASEIAFIRRTHYGEDYQIKAKPEARNAAYLSGLLQLHTDLPYYDYKPGVIMLHCIVQTKIKGGENLLTDGFYVAEKLRAENKEVFDILSQTEVNWFDIGIEGGFKFHKILRAPVIGLDYQGRLQYLTQSIHLRDSHFTVNLRNVKPWYRAMKVFVEEISKHAAEFKTKPGNVLAFDNKRLIHGRLAYEDSPDNQRLLVGCYLDWDEIYSKLRVLQGELRQQGV